MESDPVCGMLVDEAVSEVTTYHERQYYFCSAECYSAFVRNPVGYLKYPPQRDSVDGVPTQTQRVRFGR